jgi:hypothetical protein
MTFPNRPILPISSPRRPAALLVALALALIVAGAGTARADQAPDQAPLPPTAPATPATTSTTPAPEPTMTAPASTPPPSSPSPAQPSMESVPEMSSPTDQPPPEVPLPRPISVISRALIDGDVDARYRTSDSGRTKTVWLQSEEVDVTYPIITHGMANGNVVIQALGENPPDIQGGADVEFGEVYAIYKLPIATQTDSTAYLKAGQFQIPFGLLAVYDPHLQLSQPLYAQSLGLRDDWGVAISGRFYSVLNYDLSLTRGVGPSVIGTVDPSQVVNFRLGRTLRIYGGTLNVGGSILQGRLPVTDITAAMPFAVELPPSGRVRADEGYINKSRIAGDATFTSSHWNARGEAMAGADNDQRVIGYYLEGGYHVTRRSEPIIARSYWRYPIGDSFSTDDQIGWTYGYSPNVTLRALLESLHDRPRDASTTNRKRFTVQLLVRF